MADLERKARLVIPRRTILGMTVLLGGVAAAPGFLARAAGKGGEGGEGGEGGSIEGLSPSLGFLTVMGQFEATHAIVAGLVAEGRPEDAKAHLEESHHAFYEDIEDGLEDRGVAPFEEEAEAFAEAVRSGADPARIAAAAEAVTGPIHGCLSLFPAADILAASRQLVLIAAGDFEGGVEAGEVVAPQEYRDAWGFSHVAATWIGGLTESPDPATAEAAARALDALSPTAALFPSLGSARAGGDASALHAAAARIEIAALRLG